MKNPIHLRNRIKELKAELKKAERELEQSLNALKGDVAVCKCTRFFDFAPHHALCPRTGIREK